MQDENGVPYEIVDYCDIVIRCLPEDAECSVRQYEQDKYCNEIQEPESYPIHVPEDTSGPLGDTLICSGAILLVFAVAFLIIGVLVKKDK